MLLSTGISSNEVIKQSLLSAYKYKNPNEICLMHCVSSYPLNYENINFSLDITCQEAPEWTETYEVEVMISRWSNLNFGANDGSSFYVQQNVNTSLAVNISNTAGFADMAKIRMSTESDWQYGFVDDANWDNEVHIDLEDGEDVFFSCWCKKVEPLFYVFEIGYILWHIPDFRSAQHRINLGLAMGLESRGIRIFQADGSTTMILPSDMS